MIDRKALALEVASEHTDAADLLAAIRDVVHENPEIAADTVKEARHRFRVIDERRTQITKPLLAAKRSVDELFKPLLDTYKRIDAIATEAVCMHERRALESQRAALAAAATEEEIAIAAAPATTLPVDGSVATRRVLRCEVTDWRAVPEGLLRLDAATALSMHRAGDHVPGVRFYYDSTLVVK